MYMQINNSTSLKAAIRQLEEKQFIQKEALVDQFHETYESLKPVNIVKNQFKKLTDSMGQGFKSSETKNTLINTAIGVGVGFLTKRLFIGGSHNILKRLFGTAVQMGVTKLVAANADKIKDKGMELIHSNARNAQVL
jgi:hypothetical protein